MREELQFVVFVNGTACIDRGFVRLTRFLNKLGQLVAGRVVGISYCALDAG